VIGEIIAKLGLRYRPSGQADLEAHGHALVLLAEDVADIPPPLLDEAARRWAREQRFMPRASELREMARKVQSDRLQGTDAAGQQLQSHCDSLNSLRWVQNKGIRYVVGRDSDGQRMITEARGARA
jgi:hypothetical protein